MNNIHEFLSKALDGATIDENHNLILPGVSTQPSGPLPPPEEIQALLEDYFRDCSDSPWP